jgi:hypothetical protein
MLIAFKEAKFGNAEELEYAYSLLGGRTYETKTPESLLNGKVYDRQTGFLVELNDGNAPMMINDPESNSGIRYDFLDDFIHIDRLHTNFLARGQGLANNLLLPLMKYAEEKGIKKFVLRSTNDSFWKYVKKKHTQFTWEIKWHKGLLKTILSELNLIRRFGRDFQGSHPSYRRRNS